MNGNLQSGGSIKLLFWNLNQSPLSDEIGHICLENNIDVVLLAENNIGAASTTAALNRGASKKFQYIWNPLDRIGCFSCLPTGAITNVHDSNWMSAKLVKPVLGDEVLLVAIHFGSKLYLQDDEQSLLYPRIRDKIEELEAKQGHSRTVVIGDLNQNPFEHGVASSEGLHGVMCRHAAAEESRIVAGEPRKYFYNPMWSLIGDASTGPTGTYYYRGSVVSYFWNAFDQVLLRPSLLSEYKASDVKILDCINGRALVNDGRMSAGFSDHLPITAIVRT